MYNWDNQASYEKWMNDFADVQTPAGEFPGIVPTGGWGYGTGPAWDSAYVLIPWYLYQYTGDSTALQQQFPGMKRYVDFLQTRQKGQIVDYGLGDWVCPKTQTWNAVTSTGYYYTDARIVAQAAALLGNQADAARYNELADHIRDAFRAKFLKPDGTVDNGSICAQRCALYQGFTTPEDCQKVTDLLVKEIAKQGYTWDCGILGAKYVLNALTENGHVEDAYRLATQTTAPSYGYWVKQGATTLWEDWYGGASLNHIMFGDISAWFYKTLAGINLDPAQPGFKHIIIRPRPVGDLTWVRASHDSPYGTIRSTWRKEKGAFRLDVTVPVNATATVYVPTASAQAVTESGKPAATAPGVRYVRTEEGCAVFEIGSGEYQFASR